MAVVNIIAKFLGTDVETGFQRLGTASEEFKNKLEKNLSGAGLVKGLASALAGLNLAELIAAPFEKAAEMSGIMADNAERAAKATREAILVNTSPEGHVLNDTNEIKYAKARLGQIDAQLNDRPAWWKFDKGLGDYVDHPLISSVEAKAVGALQKIPIVGGFFDGSNAPGKMLQRVTALQTEKSMLEAQITSAGGSIKAAQRDISRENRHVGQDELRSYDDQNVARGIISRSEAQRHKIGRLEAELDAVNADPIASAAQKKAARTALRDADTALIPIQVQERFNRIQGITPQISASSLARIGGGGNVNVFGGREGALEIEAKAHTELLRIIATNTARGASQEEAQ